jgi:hypothetical protein
MLPENIKQAIEEWVNEAYETETARVHTKGFMEKGAELALSALTPPGDLVEELREVIPKSWKTLEIVEQCAAVAHRHMEALKAENERLKELLMKWNKEIGWLIPGGSEYIDDPARCAEAIKSRYEMDAAKLERLKPPQIS